MTRRKKTMILLLLSFFLVALLSALSFLRSKAFQEYVKTQFVEYLNRSSGGKTTIESLGIEFFPLRVFIANLRIQSKENTLDPPFLSVRSIEARPRFRSLLGSLQIRALRLVEPKVIIEFKPDGSPNFSWPLKAGEHELFSAVIEKLKIENGTFQFREHQTPLDTSLENISISARYQSAMDAYQVQFAYAKGILRLGPRTWDYGLSLSLEILRDEVKVETLMASTNGANLEAKGAVKNWKSPQGIFTYQGTMDIAAAKPFFPEFRDSKGSLRLAGIFDFSPKHWETTGTLEGLKLSISSSRIDRVSSQYLVNNEQVRFEKVKIAGMHGRADGSLIIRSPFQSRHYEADFKLVDIGLLDLSLIAHLEKARFTGSIQGTLKASWMDRWKNFAGEGHLIIAPISGEEATHEMTSKVLPLSGELNFMMTQWDSNFERSHLRLGHSQMQFGGTLSVNRTSNLQMEFVSEDLRDFAFLFPELKGSASFNGIAQGTSSNPNLSGSFKASHLTFQKFQADQINGQLEADPREVNVIHAVVKTGNSNVSVQGKFFLDPIRYFPPVNLHLLLKLKETSTEDLAAMIGEKLPASGLFSGDFVATGKYPQITVRGDAELHDGKFFNQPFDKGQFEIHYLEPILELPKLAVQLGTGILNGSAKVNLEEQTMTSILTGSAIPLDRIQWLRFPENPVSGQIRKMNLKAEGPFRLPSLNGEMDIAEIALAGEPVGDFRVKFQTDHQVLRITTESTNPSVRLKAVGSVGLNENLDLNAQLTFENLVLSPYVKKVLPVIPEKLTSQAEGQIVITGPLRAPEKLLTTGTLDSMRINFREAQLQAAKPFQIEIRNEKVTIKQALFTGKGTVLNLDGTIDLTQKKRLDLNMKGNFDLALLNEFVKKLSASGNGTVNAAIRGTLLDPRIQGQAQINNGQFSYADLPNSFSQLTGTLYFDENQIKVDNLTGSSGGGKVQVNGDLLFGQEMIKLLNLRIQGSEVRIRYPEKMRNVVDADLVLRGSEKSQLLSGNIRILSSSFQKGYDPITQYLENRSSRTRWPGARELGNMLSLDLTITGDRNIKLDTPLIKMSSRADLKVKGTAENPQVTGSIESSGGDIYFQGTRYRVTRGRLEFVNPVRIDPRIDLEAETDVRDYRVVLTINGTADKFRADLRSDPPLSTFDLFSLVSAGGTGLSNTGVRSTFRPNAMSGRQQDSSLGAATLLSEGLSLKMGSRVKRIFGLDRFRVDPFLVGNERDPSARVTFGQQVTKDVSVTYSTSLSSNEQQVILVEYNLNDSTSFIASRDAEGSFGLDVRFRKRLRQKHR